jgi:hypothetical protein
MKCELIIERDGKPIYRGKTKSFLKNFGSVLAGMLKNTGAGDAAKYASVTNTAGASANAIVEDYVTYTGWSFGPMTFNAGDNDDSYGIQVGSGSDPVSYNDYKLASKISHGTSTGQLDYETQSVVSSYSDTSSYIEISRSFINKTSSDVIVREVGLVARSWDTGRGVDTKFLVVRDVLPAPVKVKPLGSLTVRYRVSLST